MQHHNHHALISRRSSRHLEIEATSPGWFGRVLYLNQFQARNTMLVNSIVARQWPVTNVGLLTRTMASSSLSTEFKPLHRSWKSVKKVTRNTELALAHFDSLYAKVYGRAWPSIRLGLLTTKKQCAIINPFADVGSLHERLVEEDGAIDLERYYKKHLQSYTRWKLRQQIIENKKARKRELLAKEANISAASIDLDSIEVSDVSDSELKGTQTSDSEGEGFSTAEDLMAMFSDRRMDDDEKYFINKASPMLNLNDFVPATELITKEEYTDESIYYEGYDTDLKLDIEFQDEPYLEFYDRLKIYAFPRNSWDSFESPTAIKRDDLLTHYLLDGGSILPILALDLQTDDICADYCAAPGGKSLAMLMTFRPKYLLCNDRATNRLSRTYNVMRQYVPEVNYIKSTLRLSNHDARSLVQPDAFDKILVDAPCSNDRVSVESLENNLFKRTRSAERLQLPQTQCDLLKSALKSVRPKGCVVYSTCTLSPLENDCVVQKALQGLQEEGHPSRFAVINLKEAFRPLRGLFKFNNQTKYGQQLLPTVTSNFGPTYVCKIKRLS
jgi:hypothetical protein